LELKMNYKNTPKKMGVYQIKNQINGKVFVGSSMNLESRINRHKFELKWGSEGNEQLLHDWKEHGPENFTFDVLEYLKPEDGKDISEHYQTYKKKVEEMEEKWLNQMQPYGERGYNQAAKTE